MDNVLSPLREHNAEVIRFVIKRILEGGNAPHVNTVGWNDTEKTVLSREIVKAQRGYTARMPKFKAKAA